MQSGWAKIPGSWRAEEGGGRGLVPHGESHASVMGSFHGWAYGDSERNLPEVT